MSEVHPMRSPAIDEQYWLDYCSEIFGGLDMTNYPKSSETIIDQGGVDTAGTNIFFGNGGEDPW